MGISVGDAVGSNVGSALGSPVGAMDGAAVGSMLLSLQTRELAESLKKIAPLLSTNTVDGLPTALVVAIDPLTAALAAPVPAMMDSVAVDAENVLM